MSENSLINLSLKNGIVIADKFGSNRKFYIIKVFSNETLEEFVLYSMLYLEMNRSYKNKFGKSLVIGIDFEFSRGEIALWQICFFPMRTKSPNFVFVVDPNVIKDRMEILEKTIFTSPIHKIVHGAESLDIPYIFKDILKNDVSKIISFSQHVMDTRFLCEYYKLYSDTQNQKCNLYDSLLYFNVIDKAKHEELTDINKKIGKIYNVKWNINTMGADELKYAVYDVLYLRSLIMKIFASIGKINKYKLKLVCEINRLLYYVKYDIYKLKSISLEKSEQLLYEKIFSNNTDLALVRRIDNFKNIISLLIKQVAHKSLYPSDIHKLKELKLNNLVAILETIIISQII